MLSKAHIQFIKENIDSQLTELVLKGFPFEDVDASFLAQQISARQRMKKKLPSWIAKDDVVFPPKLNLAQSSSEETANYKAKIINGSEVADLTGGFGIDAFALAKTNKHVIYTEKDDSLFNLVHYNSTVFELKNFEMIQTTAETFLKNTKSKLDWIYLDPSRRDEAKKRVFLFEDCQPNILSLLPILQTKCDFLLMKTSPLIDLSYGIKELKYVRKIHIVAVENEVKELLWELDFSNEEILPSFKCIQFKKGKQIEFEITKDEASTEVTYAKPLQYLYEPNAALMKVGKFNQLAESFQLQKLHPNSHLFISATLEKEFPGRVFFVKKVEEYKPKQLKKQLKGKKMNISTRNFPLMAKDLIKLFKTKDGGENYVFFTTDFNQQKIVISCIKAM
ncbi:THUMP-like domain-containing protein [Psychroflexus planctonicus]|uniref:THUMP-like domain-containing protein n=1 Tax=Psychroflexus planctonicus TaxID=1526575 RepID=A0ABQ1SCU9_9FLAO|nr:RsmD family RNA methyltransferase [Psychroflexus planctonicus]GGE27181.1 hypothetical protein GCM10010832_04920 [Psychroflexus planctonicus]